MIEELAKLLQKYMETTEHDTCQRDAPYLGPRPWCFEEDPEDPSGWCLLCVTEILTSKVLERIEDPGSWMGPFPKGEPWIGVDLDGTLAKYDGRVSLTHIGEPIPPMVERVRTWIEEGKSVAIVTARVADYYERQNVLGAIREWCREHIGHVIPITHIKNYGMVECWDDRAIQVVRNTGVSISDAFDRKFLEARESHLRFER